jgi:hypothetical protein
MLIMRGLAKHTAQVQTRSKWSNKHPWKMASGARTEDETFNTQDDKGTDQIQNWPVFMIGCHKRKDQSSYREFGYPLASYDELAFWERNLSLTKPWMKPFISWEATVIHLLKSKSVNV